MSGRLIVLDMDGTMADFHAEDSCMERMYEPNFYFNLKPYPLTEAVDILSRCVYNNFYILSACVNDACRQEKLRWIEKYLPSIKRDHVILCDVGEDKSKYFDSDLISRAVLIDDYSKNLCDWQTAGGQILKAYNGLNCEHTPLRDAINVTDKEESFRALIRLLVDCE